MKNLKKILSVVLLVIILALFIYYIKNNLHDFTSITLVNPIWMIAILFTSLIFSYTNGLVIRLQMQSFKINLKPKEWFGLSVITTFYNTITPFRGGLLAKATYLKNKYKFSYTNSLATISGIYVINFFAASIIGLIALLSIYMNYGIFNPIITLMYLGFFFPTAFLILFSPKFPMTKYRIINKFFEVANGWHTLRKEIWIVSRLSVITITQAIVLSISTMISFYVFDIALPFDKAIFLVTISTFSVLVAITPAGLGIGEAIAVFSGLIIGITPAQSLSVAIMGRVVGAVYIFILGPIFSYILLKEHKKI